MKEKNSEDGKYSLQLHCHILSSITERKKAGWIFVANYQTLPSIPPTPCSTDSLHVWNRAEAPTPGHPFPGLGDYGTLLVWPFPSKACVTLLQLTHHWVHLLFRDGTLFIQNGKDMAKSSVPSPVVYTQHPGPCKVEPVWLLGANTSSI